MISKIFRFIQPSKSVTVNDQLAHDMENFSHFVRDYSTEIENGIFGDVEISEKLKLLQIDMKEFKLRMQEVSDLTEHRIFSEKLSDLFEIIGEIPYLIPQRKYDDLAQKNYARLELSEMDLIYLNSCSEETRDATLMRMSAGKYIARGQYEISCVKWREISIKNKKIKPPAARVRDKPDRGWW